MKASTLKPTTTAQSLGALLKAARHIMRKDKGPNGDRECLTEMLHVRPISDDDNLHETIGKCDDADQLPDVVNQLQTLLNTN
jgi:type I restriction enzyme M protein